MRHELTLLALRFVYQRFTVEVFEMRGSCFLRHACGQSICSIDSAVVVFHELDLLWTLRLFVKGGAWRITWDTDIGSAFPGFAAFSKRMEPFVKLVEDDEGEFDNIGELLDRLYKEKLISYEEAHGVPHEFLEALRKQEEHLKESEPLLSPLKENVELFSETFGFSQVEKTLFTFIVLVANHSTLLHHYAHWFQCERNISLVASIMACATEIPEQEIYELLVEKRGCLFQIIDLNFESSNADVDEYFCCKRGLNFFTISSIKLTKKDIEDLFFSEAPTSELTLEDYHHIPEIEETLVPYLRYALNHSRQGVNVLLYGAPGTGKTQLTRALGQELSTPVFEIVNHSVKEKEEVSSVSIDRLHAWEIANSFVDEKSPAIFVLDESEDIFLSGLSFYNGTPIRDNKAEINHLLESNPHPTLWLTNSLRGMDSAMLRRFDLVIEVTQPTVEQRLAIIDKCVGNLLSEDMKGRLARTENLSPAVISRTVSVLKALEKPTQEERDKKMLTLISSVLEVQNAGTVAPKLAPVDTVYDTTFVHTDVNLEELARGINSHASARLCLYGPPGTGKTAYAIRLAKFLKKPLIQKKSSDILSKWVGGTEANIAKAFEQARRENAILLIDEADSFLQDRSQSHYSWETTQVNEMLTQMESFEGIFIATTNLVETLDAASLRRFDLKAKFDYLSETQALALYSRWIKELGLQSSFRLEKDIRSLTALTPGDFASVIRQSKFNPISSAEDFANRLVAECELKDAYSGRKKAIGFC